VESASDFYSSRLTKKERKARIADELLSDSSLTQYRYYTRMQEYSFLCVVFCLCLHMLTHAFAFLRKRKVREIEELNQPGGNEKWKIRGKHSKMRAKERRQKRH